MARCEFRVESNPKFLTATIFFKKNCLNIFSYLIGVILSIYEWFSNELINHERLLVFILDFGLGIVVFSTVHN
jgi:hypothetical protein